MAKSLPPFPFPMPPKAGGKSSAKGPSKPGKGPAVVIEIGAPKKGMKK